MTRLESIRIVHPVLIHSIFAKKFTTNLTYANRVGSKQYTAQIDAICQILSKPKIRANVIQIEFYTQHTQSKQLPRIDNNIAFDLLFT